MDTDFFEFDENDYVVRVRPTVVNNEWTGEIDIAIVTSADNNLEDDSYSQMMHFTKMMCATVPLMEANEDMRNFVHTYVIEEIDKDFTSVVEEKSEVTFTHEDGNVIRLNFGTRTKGSA
jgi:hypothetical protein